MNATVRIKPGSRPFDLFGEILEEDKLFLVLDTGRAEFGIIELARLQIVKIWKHEPAKVPEPEAVTVPDDDDCE